jgi:hypothetical protein
MEKPMTSHRPLRSTVDGLAIVAIAAAFMAAGPIGAASAAGLGGGGSGVGAGVGAAAASGQASNGSGYEPSETDCVTIAQQPGRYTPDDLAACGIIAPMGGYGYYQPRG